MFGSDESESKVLTSHEEMRLRILANAAVLFPLHPSEDASYTIVYATYPSEQQPKAKTPTPPSWEYAILLKVHSAGGSVPLVKGGSWSSSMPWSMALRGLLDTTASAVHKKFKDADMAVVAKDKVKDHSTSSSRHTEELPEYTPPAERGFAGVERENVVPTADQKG